MDKKKIEVRLAKAYKSTLENEKKLKTYINERHSNRPKRTGK
jgi:hypothetical protein